MGTSCTIFVQAVLHPRSTTSLVSKKDKPLAKLSFERGSCKKQTQISCNICDPEVKPCVDIFYF